MGNWTAYPNYHADLNFDADLFEQIQFHSNFTHASLGPISLWRRAKEIKPSIFSKVISEVILDFPLLRP